MQTAAFSLNLPAPVLKALNVLEPGTEGAEGHPLWTELAERLEALTNGSGDGLGLGFGAELPEDLDPADLAAWLAAALGGEPLPQAGKDLPMPPGLEGSRPAAPNLPQLREQLLAAAVHAAANGEAAAPGTRPGLPPGGLLELAGLGARAAEAPAFQTLIATPLTTAGGEGSSTLLNSAATLTQAGLPKLFNLDVPLHQPGWDRALGNRVQWMVNQNIQVAELRLNPPNLGPLEVRLQMDGDRTHINFVTPQAAVRDAVDAALPRLREMFAEGGLSLGDVTVSHQGAGEGEAGGGDAEGEAGGGERGQAGDGGEPMAPGTGGRSGEGLVDYYA